LAPAAARSTAEAAAAALVEAGQAVARSHASALVADSDPEAAAPSAGTSPGPRADSAGAPQPSAGLALDAGTLDLLDAHVAIDADFQRAIDAFSPAPRDASDSRVVAHLASGASLLAADVLPNESARVVTPARVPPAEFPAFLDKLAVRVDASANRALVELEPPALGRLTVEIVVEDDRIRADVRVERPEGLAALEARLPELRASFTERGFTAADVQLSLGFDQPASSQRDARETQRSTRSARELDLAPELLESLVPARAGGLDLWA
jgi:flagellar hook-length control protein FliK